MNFSNINNEYQYNQELEKAAESFINDYLCLEYTDSEVLSEDDFYDKLSDELFQYVDNSLIYYHSHDVVLSHSKNTEAYEDMGIELKGSWLEIKAQIAFYAFEADLRELIDYESYLDTLKEEMKTLETEFKDELINQGFASVHSQAILNHFNDLLGIPDSEDSDDLSKYIEFLFSPFKNMDSNILVTENNGELGLAWIEWDGYTFGIYGGIANIGIICQTPFVVESHLFEDYLSELIHSEEDETLKGDLD